MTGKRRARRKASGTSGGHQIGPGTVAALAYELLDAEGELVEASEPGAPLVLLFGFGEAAPALEQALQGLGEGESREVTLPPDEAFGARDPEAIIEVDRADFPPDVAAGDELEADREDGRGAVPLKVIEVLDDVVVLDTNHPLAGQRVKLLVTVEAVRPASADEIAEATERLLQNQTEKLPQAEPLLPAERLLRRVRGESTHDRDEPPPPPSGRTD
jgi:FKBP-type peptidyl-prolyl cis-trans isomerase SlyD